MIDNVHITYLFDPLCGWCYGASGIMGRLSFRQDFDITLAPTGLFADRGARPMDAQFAAFAWSNDLRIGRLTGQDFTENYRTKVLDKRGSMLDSGPATLALTAVVLTKPAAELEALRLIQEARYVRGLDVTDNLVLIEILGQSGFLAAASRLAAPDEELVTKNRLRVADARALGDKFGVDGVPALIVDNGRNSRHVGANALLSDADLLLGLLGVKSSAAGVGR